MMSALTAMRQWLRRDEAQDLIEYGMLAALIAIAGITMVGNTIFTVFWQNIAQAV